MNSITCVPKQDECKVDPQEQLVSALRKPVTFGDSTSAVEVIETHISRVFLTDRYAYKLLKPARYEFLDFRTREDRYRAAIDEVKLNSELAPRVYLDVIPVVRAGHGGISVGGRGVALDWLIKMRRLPAEKALDAALQQDGVSVGQIRELAEVLAQFYERTPPVTVQVEEYRKHVKQHVLANRTELRSSDQLDQKCVERVHAQQLRYLKLAEQVFDDRVRDGRIVEGHGDLRPEHIYFVNRPVVIDRIAFSQDFRTVDVADELSFLSMECERLGHRRLTEPILRRYSEVSGDYPDPQLLDFYRCYRACVRAKVLLMQARQHMDSALYREASRYLELASGYAGRLGPPAVIVVRGLPGTGKSSVADVVSRELGCQLLSTDEIRRELFRAEEDVPDFDQGRYTSQSRHAVYREMHTRAERVLKKGLSVVLDGTYLEADLRAEVAEIATRTNSGLVVLHTNCPAALAIQRIVERTQSHSETRPEFFARQQRRQEPDPPRLESLEVDTTAGVTMAATAACNKLRKLCLQRRSHLGSANSP